MSPQNGRLGNFLVISSVTSSISTIIVPGWRDSGPGHWQTLWAQRLEGARRVVQDDWMTPVRSAWVGHLEKTVLEAPHPVVIVAHSLGCIASIHMGAEAAAKVCGALLVAPADPERRAIHAIATMVAKTAVTRVVWPDGKLSAAFSSSSACTVWVGGR